jgi:hypothetical protein
VRPVSPSPDNIAATLPTLDSSRPTSPQPATPWSPPRSSWPLNSIPAPAAAAGIALIVAILAAQLIVPTLRRNGLVLLAHTSWRRSVFFDVLTRPG